jgi:hypothetical protein
VEKIIYCFFDGDDELWGHRLTGVFVGFNLEWGKFGGKKM